MLHAQLNYMYIHRHILHKTYEIGIQINLTFII